MPPAFKSHAVEIEQATAQDSRPRPIKQNLVAGYLIISPSV
jgi:hypothetical protein